MPVYEYACKACGHHLEVSQSFKDEPLTTCPLCAGELRKVFGSIGVVLKGSGFYRTDNRNRTSGSKDRTAEKAGSGDGKGSDSKGSDAKGSDTKAGETKSSDAKSSDGKSSGSKADTKPSTTAAKSA